MIQDVYGTGTGATATATADENGAITRIDTDQQGKDYTAPVVIIKNAADPQGIGAMATATIGDEDWLAQRWRPEVRRPAARPGSCERQRERAVHSGSHPGHENVPGLRLLRDRAGSVHREAAQRSAPHHAARLPAGQHQRSNGEQVQLPGAPHHR